MNQQAREAKRAIDLWLVWYTYQLDYPLKEYLDLMDVVTMWTWKGSEISELARLPVLEHKKGVVR